jgi:hypothetical protein
MPVYNGSTYLAEAIESILNQSFGDWELLAVDDGSADGSLDVLERYAASDSRVRVLSNEINQGVSATLNHGGREARGTYLAIAHADDVCLPDRLARQTAFLDGHPAVVAVGGATILVDESGREVTTTWFPTRSRSIQKTLSRHNCFAHSAVTMRRAALLEVGGYRFDFVEDYDLWLRLSERYELANLPEPVIRYRLHPEQITAKGLNLLVRRTVAVRSAGQARRRSHVDPLAAVTDLTPDVLDQLQLDESEVTSALELEWLSWAPLLDELGRHQEAEELYAQAAHSLGRGAPRILAASRELARATRLLAEGNRSAATARVGAAFAHHPRYTTTRLSRWLGDHVRGRARVPWA